MCDDNVLGSVIARSMAACIDCSIEPCHVGTYHRAPEGSRPRHDVWIVAHDMDTPVTGCGHDTLCTCSRKIAPLIFRENGCEASLGKSE
jgi:hypothetical protein